MLSHIQSCQMAILHLLCRYVASCAWLMLLIMGYIINIQLAPSTTVFRGKSLFTGIAFYDSYQSLQTDPLEPPNHSYSAKATFRIRSVCPNPVKTEGVVSIEWIESSTQRTAEGHLCNIRGEIIENYTQLLQTAGEANVYLSIDANNLVNGIYFVCITSQSYSALSPVIVVK